MAGQQTLKTTALMATRCFSMQTSKRGNHRPVEGFEEGSDEQHNVLAAIGLLAEVKMKPDFFAPAIFSY